MSARKIIDQIVETKPKKIVFKPERPVRKDILAHLTKDGAFKGWDPEDLAGEFADQEEMWKEVFAKRPGDGLALNGYAYYPSKGFKTWTASDGSKCPNSSGSILEFVWYYAGKDMFDDFMQLDLHSGDGRYADDYMVKGRKDQEEYEDGVLRGDHY